MREIRPSGSEGGGVEPNRRSLPLSSLRRSALFKQLQKPHGGTVGWVQLDHGPRPAPG